MSAYLTMVALLIAIPQSDTDNDIWLTTASTRNLSSRDAFRIKVLKQYGVYTPPDAPVAPVSTARAMLDDDTMAGAVSRVLRSGLTLNTYVSTHSRPDSIERFISSQIEGYEKQYGKDGVRVERRGDAVSIYTDGGTYSLNGMEASSPAWENHYRFNSGVLASAAGLKSRKHLLGLNFARIKKELTAAKGTDTYARYEPASSDPKQIGRFKKGLSFKRTFGLPRQLHWMFSIASESKLTEYFKQVKSVEMWEKLPAENRPYEYQLELKPRPETQLAKLLTGLRPTTQARHVAESAIGTATIHLQVPDDIRFLVENLVTNFVETDSPVATSLVQRSELTIAAQLNDSAIGPVVLARASANVDQAGLEYSVRSLQDIEPGTLAVGATALPKLVGQQFDRQQVRLAANGDWLDLSIASVGEQKRPPLELQLQPRDGSAERVPLVVVNFDLKPWFAAKPDSYAAKLVHKLETVFVRGWSGGRSIEQMRDRLDIEDIVEDTDYASLRDRANSNGDWHARFSLTVDSSGTLRIRCSMGADLYGFFLVRARTLR